MGYVNRIEQLFDTLERCCNAQRTVKNDDTEQNGTNEVNVETFPLNNGGEEGKFYWGSTQGFTCRLILFYCFSLKADNVPPEQASLPHAKREIEGYALA
ncbi:predicted protein [Sclerotinia sclerotiorum 1980 UF-70]|uniref:Uncharacterized protein n=2 Tax=Sclerotinia sclerotiorum (strain ATCC 18683 / 1980 / Ss-1) TaxID=665079 RepID=A7EBE5_SCLS1|nr:predicted protein [Sclerotinia sclerotiorum 1980 UF-70]APA08830.1 hypothetical protein sscle_04g036000 [Sclerotinia sclerotiorum 1980 UF-70]EDN99773.1 predicted protein [Sclerotinia sclerotiorum 1980 UF-70]